MVSRLDIASFYARARERFEGFAAIDEGEYPTDVIDAMQVRLLRWQNRNFGTPTDCEIALGVFEEMGETVESAEASDEDIASDRDGPGQDRDAKLIDGLGDTCVYAGQLLASNRLAIGPVLELAAAKVVAWGEDDAFPGSMASVGRMAHLILKRTQRIRSGAGDAEAYRSALVDRVAACLAYAILWSDRHGPGEVQSAYLSVGAEVMARDWKANPTTGAAT